MIYLLRIPRALVLVGLTLWLAGIGIVALTINVFYAALTSDTWRDALDRVDAHRDRTARR